ncbi:MAG: YeeE/YedE family protein [Myxococcales bacterium]|nr:YeeE/YedE family protein [Myxococcales bacterium]
MAGNASSLNRETKCLLSELGSVFAHSTSIMNARLMLGALWAAAMTGPMRLSYRASPKLIVRFLPGGLLLRYGARLASGRGRFHRVRRPR